MTSEAPPPLAGQTVLITGGARRLGAAIARVMHAAGANVLIHHHRSTTSATALVDELVALRPGSAAAHAADLLNLDDLGPLVEFARTTFGGLDVLVNNASTFFPTPVGHITSADFDNLIGTNLRAPLFLSQAAAPEQIGRASCRERV